MGITANKILFFLRDWGVSTNVGMQFWVTGQKGRETLAYSKQIHGIPRRHICST